MVSSFWRFAAVVLILFTAACATAQDRPVRDFLREQLAGRRAAEAESRTGGELVLASFSLGGRERSYYVHVPPALEGRQGLPAVIAFHGGEGDGLDAVRASRLDAAAESVGYVAIFPNSDGVQWNDGRASTSGGRDDIAFVRALISDASDRFGIDPSAVFVVGMSNGGMLAQRLVCEGVQVRAVAIVVANMPSDLAARCSPPRGVPMVFFSGTADRIMPFEGGQIASARLLGAGSGGEVLSQSETLAFWSRVNGCNSSLERQALPDVAQDGTRVLRETVEACASGGPIQAYVIEGGGHTWPGSNGGQRRITGAATQDISATAEILNFFSRAGL